MVQGRYCSESVASRQTTAVRMMRVKAIRVPKGVYAMRMNHLRGVIGRRR